MVEEENEPVVVGSELVKVVNELVVEENGLQIEMELGFV